MSQDSVSFQTTLLRILMGYGSLVVKVLDYCLEGSEFDSQCPTPETDLNGSFVMWPLKRRDTNPAEVECEQYDLAVLADTLRAYLQELPCPIIPSVLYSELAYTAQEIASLEDCGQQIRMILDSPSMPQLNHQLLVYLTNHLSKVTQSGGAAQASARFLAQAYVELVFKNSHFSTDVNPDHHVKILEALIVVGGLTEMQAAPDCRGDATETPLYEHLPVFYDKACPGTEELLTVRLGSMGRFEEGDMECGGDATNMSPLPYVLTEPRPLVHGGNIGGLSRPGKQGRLIAQDALEGCEACGGMVEGVLGILGPGEELAPPVLFPTAVGAKEPPNLLIEPFRLTVGLRVVSRSQAHVNPQLGAEHPRNLRCELGPPIRYDVLR
ncbi:hypothetical protein QTP86_001340 [Hemibagrus guttatus]|nr:hypothetical protein QTP86_001340 [Hemibagrus guttatus]